MRKKGQINNLMSFLFTLVSLSSSFYLIINFFTLPITQALLLSILACLWFSLMTSMKSGYFFGFKLDKKALSKAVTYLLVLTFFILYQLFMGQEEIVFAASPNVFLSGNALNYYTGERITGNITVIPRENPENKTTAPIIEGEWSVNLSMRVEDVEHLTLVVEDDQKKGYNQLKLPILSSVKLSCTVQNISLSGYSLDADGQPTTSGNVRVSVLDTDYTNTTTFSGGTWSIDFHPCLISGQVYTLQVLISDNTGKRGEILQKYPAK